MRRPCLFKYQFDHLQMVSGHFLSLFLQFPQSQIQLIAIIFLSVLKKVYFVILIVSMGVVCVKVCAHELVPLGARGIGSPGVTDHSCPTWVLGIKPWCPGRVVCALKC